MCVYVTSSWARRVRSNNQGRKRFQTEAYKAFQRCKGEVIADYTRPLEVIVAVREGVIPLFLILSQTSRGISKMSGFVFFLLLHDTRIDGYVVLRGLCSSGKYQAWLEYRIILLTGAKTSKGMELYCDVGFVISV